MHYETRKLKVFLCHGSEDKGIVREIYRDLSDDNVDPWLDEKNILPGQDWDLEIKRAVRSADVILVCLSTATASKEGYLQKEMRMALDIADEKPEGAIFLIVLRLDPCNFPSRFANRQYLDIDGADWYQKLLLSLRARAKSIGIETLPGDRTVDCYGIPFEDGTGKILYKSRHIRELLKKVNDGKLFSSDVRPLSPEMVTSITNEALEEITAPFEGDDRKEKERDRVLALIGIRHPYLEWEEKNSKIRSFRNESPEPEAPEMVPVRSSNLSKVGYDRHKQSLFVEFRSGSVYEYFNVPENLFRGLMGAGSHGRFLNSHIKAPGFTYRQRR